jgi:hypothetical protein
MAVIRDPKEDVVKSGALRLTWISGAVGGVGALVVAFNDNITKLFGEEVSDGVKASVLIALIAAWALIAVADLLSRSITSSARLRRAPAGAITAPRGLRVKVIDGVDSPGWLVAAIRGYDDSEADAVEFLVVKAGETPKWVEQASVTLDP